MLLKNNDLYIYVVLYDASNVISDPLAADCRLQTAIFSQNSRTQSEPDAQDHSKWSATSYLADQASQMTAVGLTE